MRRLMTARLLAARFTAPLLCSPSPYRCSTPFALDSRRHGNCVHAPHVRSFVATSAAPSSTSSSLNSSSNNENGDAAAIREFPRSPTRRVMDFLEENGAQTRRAIFATFGPNSAEPFLRSKTHLTTLLRQLTKSGRVLVKPQKSETEGAKAKKSAQYVYEMRDYSRSWNKTSVARTAQKKAAALALAASADAPAAVAAAEGV